MRIQDRPPKRLGHAGSYNDQEARKLPDRTRRPLTGSPIQITDDIKRFADVGTRRMLLPMVVRWPGVTIRQSLERMARFDTRVMPLV